jgi:hypothetical protein
MLLSWCHGGVGIVIHPDMGTIKVHSTVQCESYLISKQDVRYKLCLHWLCVKPLAKRHPCATVRSEVVWLKSVFIKNTLGKARTILCTRFRYLLSLFSKRELPYRGLDMEASSDLMPMEERTHIRSVAGEVWWITCGMEICVVDNVLRRGDACLPFPEQSRSITQRQSGFQIEHVRQRQLSGTALPFFLQEPG